MKKQKLQARSISDGAPLAGCIIVIGFAFIVVESLAHGRISRDAVLFAFLGCAVGLKETSQTLTPATSTFVA
ncbi:hypothetical protein SAMN05444159_4135 [Bradyrhizobium lablabi]|uniref:Uncharacterized protein n=1 Tax=Bradyrhizobium lablabi TaxID=722472 RepID=A0A1M6V5F2_9BRAD|nr:hypothetical protein SAMN05444159_4135 [Bradyrhizobium lablabi]